MILADLRTDSSYGVYGASRDVEIQNEIAQQVWLKTDQELQALGYDSDHIGRVRAAQKAGFYDSVMGAKQPYQQAEAAQQAKIATEFQQAAQLIGGPSTLLIPALIAVGGLGLILFLSRRAS